LHVRVVAIAHRAGVDEALLLSRLDGKDRVNSKAHRAHKRQWLGQVASKEKSRSAHTDGPRQSDLDNLAGAVINSVSGIVWTDDRVTVLQHIETQWQQKPKNSQSIHIKVIWTNDQ